jgi:colicin import membrane protein
MRGFSGFTVILATICSTIIHFFVFTLLDTIPLIPKDITPRAELFMVDLVTVETARAVPQEKREVAVQKKVKTVEKKEVKKEEPTQKEVKKETVKREEKKEQVVLADHGKKAQENKKKLEVDNEQQQLAAAIKGIEERVTGREAQVSAAEIQKYPMMVENRVKGFWVIPDTLSTRELKAVVVFAIGKQGEVLNLRVKQSSGSLPYDQSVMRAISKAAPFSPPPQVLLEEEFELTFQP